MRFAHAAHAQVNGVQQRRPAFGNGVHQLVLDVLDRGGVIDQQFRLLGEGDHEEFVLRIGGAEELDHRLARLVDLVGHGTADVEDHAQRYGCVLAGEVANLLRLAVVGEREVLLLQSGHQPVHGIGDGYRNQHQVHVLAQRLGVGLQAGIDIGRRRHRSFGLLGLARHHVDVVVLRVAGDRQQNGDAKGGEQRQKEATEMHRDWTDRPMLRPVCQTGKRKGIVEYFDPISQLQPRAIGPSGVWLDVTTGRAEHLAAVMIASPLLLWMMFRTQGLSFLNCYNRECLPGIPDAPNFHIGGNPNGKNLSLSRPALQSG